MVTKQMAAVEQDPGPLDSWFLIPSTKAITPRVLRLKVPTCWKTLASDRRAW